MKILILTEMETEMERLTTRIPNTKATTHRQLSQLHRLDSSLRSGYFMSAGSSQRLCIILKQNKFTLMYVHVYARTISKLFI